MIILYLLLLSKVIFLFASFNNHINFANYQLMQIMNIKNMPQSVLATCCFLLLGTWSSSAQALVRSSLSCMGKSVTASNLAVQQTVGQSTVPGTVSAGGTDLRQGFIQPPGKTSRFVNPDERNINLWPNPSGGAFTFNVTSTTSGDFSYAIYNVNGSVTHSGKGSFNQPVYFNEGYLAQGMYFLNITDASGAAAVCKFSITR